MPATTKPSPADKAAKKSAADQIAAAESKMTDALRDEVVEMRTAVGELTEFDIIKRYKIGERLRKIAIDKTGKYGRQPMALVKATMPLSKDSLRPMIVLAETYTEPELRKLIAMNNPRTHERLTWSHVAALTRVKDKTRAAALAAKAVDEGWPSLRLVREVTAATGGRKSAGGRKPKKADTLAACLDDIRAKTQLWDNAASKSWLAAGGLDDLFVEAGPRRGDAATIEVLSDLSTELDALVVRVKTVSMTLDRLCSQARSVRTSRPAVA